MKIVIHYSVKSGGDGSAYIQLMESKELAVLDQDHDLYGEGWAETCTGSITVESDSPVHVCDEILTVEDLIKEIEDDHEVSSKYYPTKRMEALTLLKQSKDMSKC